MNNMTSNTPITLDISDEALQYTDTEQYQTVFQTLFRGTTPEEYDETAVNTGLDYLYACTKADPQWQDLYRAAAAQLLTEDLEIGLCLLLDYDCFPHFVRLFRHYHRRGFPAFAAGAEPDPEYEALFQTLQEKIIKGTKSLPPSSEVEAKAET